MARFFGASVDPVPIIRGIVQNVTSADASGYLLYDDAGDPMNTLKVIDDPSGGYFGVYHIARTSPFDGTYSTALAHSTDLQTWTRQVVLVTYADQPYIGKRADGSFIVGYGDETVSPTQVALKRYSSRANLLTGTASDSVRLPITRATSGGYEVAPVFASIEDPMDIGFVYNDGATTRDHNARGTLTGWSGSSYTSWVTATAAYETPVISLDSYVTTAATEVVPYLGTTLTFVGSQIASGEFFVNYWDGSSAVVQTITTAHSATDLDSLRCSIVASPVASGNVLYCAMVIHSGAPDGPGCAWWYKALPV